MLEHGLEQKRDVAHDQMDLYISKPKVLDLYFLPLGTP
jgi:hypothetical protein